MQKHHHRAEHWVVVRGTAEVTRDNDVLLLRENEEEDDIARVADDFGPT